LAVPPHRLAVLPLGGDHLRQVAPDTTVLDAHGLLGRPFLLAVGSMNPTKRLDRLMHVWAGLPHGDAQLVIAGGLNPRVFTGGRWPDVPGVVLTGPVGDAALKALYVAALGLVFPSVYEGFGLPPLEAMASGCPVVASRAASLPEVCGDAARMVNPDDDADLAAAMRALLNDPELRVRLRAQGLARAAGFTWDATAAALLAALAREGGP
jgi:glycosyltransferase involved in cell wall biosynthesis